MGVGFIITLILLSTLLGLFARQALAQVDEASAASFPGDEADDEPGPEAPPHSRAV